jgi:predicted ATPase/transcriptional regulator with XRE-family HTH domain
MRNAGLSNRRHIRRVAEHEDDAVPQAVTPHPFGVKLRALRIARGLSQEQLAERALTSSRTVGEFERGVRGAPHREAVRSLAEALGLPPDQHGELELDASRSRVRRAKKAASPQAVPNVPRYNTSFVGREGSVAALLSLLSQNRLVTVTGTAGIGKTRAALHAAELRCADQAIELWFADLTSIRDGSLIVSQLASSVRPAPIGAIDTLEAFAAAIRSRPALLLIDNCEHVIDSASEAAASLLSACPYLAVLATSRRPLTVAGEALYQLPSLAVPDLLTEPLRDARSYSAVGLFLDRAASSGSAPLDDSKIAVVADICRRLDGIPLAIELAAARAPMLGIHGLRDRLRERFALAGGARDVPARQQTMEAAIDWSYQLLDARERTLLRRLSALTGAWRIDLIEQACSDVQLPTTEIADALATLVNQSLLNVSTSDGITRYRLLESVRAYGLRKFVINEERHALFRRCAQWSATFSEEAQFGSPLQPDYYARFRPDLDSSRAVMEWSLMSPALSDVIVGARILTALRIFWLVLGLKGECRKWLYPALERIDERSYPRIAADLNHLLSECTVGEERRTASIAAQRLYEQIGERTHLRRLLVVLMRDYAIEKRFDEAERVTDRAFELLKEDGLLQTEWHSTLLVHRCFVHNARGRYDEARADIREAEDIARRRNDRFFIALYCLSYRAGIEFSVGNVRGAMEISEEMLAYDLDPPGGTLVKTQAYANLANGRLFLGEVDAARAAARELLVRTQSHERSSAVEAIGVLAAVACKRDLANLAARLLGFLRAWSRSIGHVFLESEERVLELVNVELRERLSQDAISFATAEGARFSFDRAAAEAMTVP